jgi:tetratricopeptide (TPR) repeat protein
MIADGTAELSRAAAMIELGRYDDAARLLAVAVAAQPDRARAWSLLSRAHLGASRPGEALAAARRAIAADPADHWPFRLASTALVSLGRGAEALAEALEARRLAPDVWRSHVCLAQAAIAAGEQALAAEAAARALALAPDEPDVQFTAGKVALSGGDLPRARAHQHAALAVDPSHPAAINELGRISLREQDIGGAAGYFLRAARAAPGVGIFGRNTEIALAKVLTNITVLTAIVVAAGIVLGVAARAGTAAVLFAMVMLTGLAGGYAAYQLRGLPPDGRRHLGRMLRRRHWLVTVAGIVAVIDGLAVAAALAAGSGYPVRSPLVPIVIALAAVTAARAMVTLIIRASRRAIR